VRQVLLFFFLAVAGGAAGGGGGGGATRGAVVTWRCAGTGVGGGGGTATRAWTGEGRAGAGGGSGDATARVVGAPLSGGRALAVWGGGVFPLCVATALAFACAVPSRWLSWLWREPGVPPFGGAFGGPPPAGGAGGAEAALLEVCTPTGVPEGGGARWAIGTTR
jgi:hypothetical protein